MEVAEAPLEGVREQSPEGADVLSIGFHGSHQVEHQSVDLG